MYEMNQYIHKDKVKQQLTCFKHKKMFRTKIWEIQVLLSSFDFIRIKYQCNRTNVLRNEC